MHTLRSQVRCEGMEIGSYNAAAARSVLNADVYAAAPFNSTTSDLNIFSSPTSVVQRGFIIYGGSYQLNIFVR
jgi:hypothetical protein